MKGTVYAKDGEFTGTIHARSGEFSGSIKAATLDGRLVGGQGGSGIIEGVSLNIGNGNFTVDSGGHAVIKKGSISWSAVTGTEVIDRRIEDAQDTADGAASRASSVNSALTALKNNLGFTYIDGEYVISPNIIGGQITSNTKINVGTDASIGEKLILNANNFLSGIEWRLVRNNNQRIAEIYIDPASKTLFIKALGKVVINDIVFDGLAKFA